MAIKLLKKVFQSLDSGMSEEEVREKLRAKPKTISRCKREIELKNEIRRLIEQGEFAEAQRVASNLETAKIIDVSTLFTLQELASKVGDVEQTKELLGVLQNRQLNYRQQKQALYFVLELEPDNLEVIGRLLEIARKQKDYEQEKILKEKKNNIKNGERNKKRKEKLERMQVILPLKENDLHLIQQARELIYQDNVSMLEDVNSLLEGVEEIDVTLVLAELYAHFGMKERAEKLLKGYKRDLDTNTQANDIRIINQAIEVVKTKKVFPNRWEEFWQNRGQKNLQDELTPRDTLEDDINR